MRLFMRKSVSILFRVICCLGFLLGSGLFRQENGVVIAADWHAVPNASINQAATQATLSLPVTNASIGQALVINVTINSTDPTRAAQLAITFNPSILRCDGVDEGTFYSNWAHANGATTMFFPAPTCDNANGIITQLGIVVLGGTGGPNNSGVVAVLHFTALANGTSPLGITQSKVVDATQKGKPLTLTTTDGMVVVGPTAVPTFTPTGVVLPTGTFTQTLTPTITFTPNPNGPCCDRSDVNKDGVIDIADVGRVGLHFGETGTSGWIPEDVNQDGVVDIADVARIGLCMGLPPTCITGSTSTPTPTGQVPTPSPTTTRTVTPTLTPTFTATQSSVASLTPTVTITPNPNFSPTITQTPTQSATSTPFMLISNTPVASSTPVPTIASNSRMSFDPVQSIIAAQGTSFTVNVILSTDAASRSASASVNYDPAILDCTQVDEGTFYKSYATAHGGTTLFFPGPTINHATGKISVAGITIVGATNGNTSGPLGGPSGSGTFLVLHFTARATGVSLISLGDLKLVNDVMTGNSMGVLNLSADKGEVFVGVTPTAGLTTPTGQTTETTSSSATTTLTPTNTITPTITITPTPVASIVVKGPTAPVTVGQAFDVQINLTIPIASRSAQFNITYDPAILRCESVDVGSFYNDWANANGASVLVVPTPACDNTAGKLSEYVGLTITGGPPSGPSGSGTIFVVHFTALAIGTSSLTLGSSMQVWDITLPKPKQVSLGVTNGQVTVSSGSTQTSTVTQTKTITPSPSVTVTQTQTLTLTQTVSETAGLGALASITPLPSGTFLPTLASSSRFGFSPAQSLITAQGTSFIVNVVLSTDRATRSAVATISYDPAVLDCTQVEEGAFFKSYAIAHNGSTLVYPSLSINHGTGKIGPAGITITETGSDLPGVKGGANGNGTFLVLHFTAKTTGVSSLTLSGVKLVNDVKVGNQYSALSVSVESGQVFVGVTPTATPLGQTGATALPTLSSGTNVAVTPSANDTPIATGGPGDTTPAPGDTAQAGGTGSDQTTPAPGSDQSGMDNPGALGSGGNLPPAVSVKQSLAGKTDSNGILKQDVKLQSSGEPWTINLAAGTQALAPDNRPLLFVEVKRQNQAPPVGKDSNLVGFAYDFGPTGATFDPPGTISFSYDKTSLPKNVSENSLTIATYDTKTGKWMPLSSSVDEKLHLVTAKISHFSAYALISRASGVNWVWVGVGSVVIEVLIALAVLYYLRQRRSQKASVRLAPDVIYLLPPGTLIQEANPDPEAGKILPDSGGSDTLTLRGDL